MKSTVTPKMGLLLGPDCNDVFLLTFTTRKLRVQWVDLWQMSRTLCHYGCNDFSHITLLVIILFLHILYYMVYFFVNLLKIFLKTPEYFYLQPCYLYLRLHLYIHL